MNWDLILQIVVPLGALMVWVYNRIDKRFDKIDQKFEKIDQRFDRIDSQLQDVNTRVSRIEGAMWYCDHKHSGTEQK